MCQGFSTTELSVLFPGWRAEMCMEHPQGAFSNRSTTRDWQLLDIDTYLIDNNLARMDRGSMAHGLEVRVPMLDHRLVELALSLPADLNPATGGGKLLLRRIASERLPAKLMNKQKQGFSFPLQRYVTPEKMAHGIVGGVLVEHGIVDRKALSAWLAAAAGGNHPLKLWLLYVLEQWAVRWLFPVARRAGSGRREDSARNGTYLANVE